MTWHTRTALFLLAASVAGCSTVNDLMDSRKIDYQSAGKLPPLEIPPDLTRPSTDDRYLVPDATPAGTATFSAYSRDRAVRPVNSNPSVLPDAAGSARIERAGTQRWLVVKGTPDVLWPVIKDFWRETGFLVNVEMPEAGVMETDWAENRAKLPLGPIRGSLARVFGAVYSTSERDKFRTRLERGSAPGTTEVYVSHRGMVEVLESGSSGDEKKTIWQPRPADPELEAEMLRRLMVRLGVQEQRAQAELVRRTEVVRAHLQEGEGGRVLALDDQFDRAWRRVGLALDRVGFTVEDRDRSKGLYFVRYVDPDADNKAKKGLLSRLAFWRDDTPADRTQQYRIRVRDANTTTFVNVLDKGGEVVNTDTANRILALLLDQLK